MLAEVGKDRLPEAFLIVEKLILQDERTRLASQVFVSVPVCMFPCTRMTGRIDRGWFPK